MRRSVNSTKEGRRGPDFKTDLTTLPYLEKADMDKMKDLSRHQVIFFHAQPDDHTN